MLKSWNSKLGLCGTLLLAFALLTPSVDAEWSFVRGDGNGDGNADIADAVFGLNALFLAGPTPCFDALDVNDDGAVDIADPISLLDVLFGTGGATPPAPYPTCGEDPTADSLDCVGPLNGCPEVPSGCTDNSQCATGEHCRTALGDCGGLGNCEPIPFICPGIFAPVCGCDGQDYASDCNAWAAGTSVDLSGSCPVVGGCTTNSNCLPGEFCQKALGNCNGTGDCMPVPFICTFIFLPVCGCDGNTYNNECVGWSNGVSADFQGMCP